jgi:hypothetical protein
VPIGQAQVAAANVALSSEFFVQIKFVCVVEFQRNLKYEFLLFEKVLI